MFSGLITPPTAAPAPLLSRKLFTVSKSPNMGSMVFWGAATALGRGDDKSPALAAVEVSGKGVASAATMLGVVSWAARVGAQPCKNMAREARPISAMLPNFRIHPIIFSSSFLRLSPL